MCANYGWKENEWNVLVIFSGIPLAESLVWQQCQKNCLQSHKFCCVNSGDPQMGGGDDTVQSKGSAECM